MTAIPAKVALAVKMRSNLLCEACAQSRAEHLHHRKLRSQGGQNTAENLLHVCSACHHEIHMHPAESYYRGLLVRGSADPADVEILPFYEAYSPEGAA